MLQKRYTDLTMSHSLYFIKSLKKNINQNLIYNFSSYTNRAVTTLRIGYKIQKDSAAVFNDPKETHTVCGQKVESWEVYAGGT